VDIQRYDRGRLIGLTRLGLGAGPNWTKRGLSDAQRGGRYPTILCEVWYNGRGCPFVLVDSKSIPQKALTAEFENVLYSLKISKIDELCHLLCSHSEAENPPIESCNPNEQSEPFLLLLMNSSIQLKAAIFGRKAFAHQFLVLRLHQVVL
jgi:hypothetical protein